MSGFQCCVHGFMSTYVNSTALKVSNTLQVVCQQTESYCGRLLIKRKHSIAYCSSWSAKSGNIVLSNNFSQHRYKCNDRNMWQHKWDVSTHADHEQRSEWRPVYCCSQHPASYIDTFEATHLAPTNINEYKSSRAKNCSNSYAIIFT